MAATQQTSSESAAPKGSFQEFPNLLWQMTLLGPIGQARAMYAAAPYALQGIGPAGARATAALVDADYTERAAEVTVALVRAGYTNSVIVPVVVELVRIERDDAVAKIAMAVVKAGYVVEASAMSDALIETGHTEEATVVSKTFASHGIDAAVEQVKSVGQSIYSAVVGEDASKNSEQGQQGDATDKGKDDSSGNATSAS